MEKATLNRCQKCRYVWNSRWQRIPKECPNCKSRNWRKVVKAQQSHTQGGKE